jgi:hypothetical protein
MFAGRSIPGVEHLSALLETSNLLGHLYLVKKMKCCDSGPWPLAHKFFIAKIDKFYNKLEFFSLA